MAFRARRLLEPGPRRLRSHFTRVCHELPKCDGDSGFVGGPTRTAWLSSPPPPRPCAAPGLLSPHSPSRPRPTPVGTRQAGPERPREATRRSALSEVKGAGPVAVPTPAGSAWGLGPAPARLSLCVKPAPEPASPSSRPRRPPGRAVLQAPPSSRPRPPPGPAVLQAPPASWPLLSCLFHSEPPSLLFGASTMRRSALPAPFLPPLPKATPRRVGSR